MGRLAAADITAALVISTVPTCDTKTARRSRSNICSSSSSVVSLFTRRWPEVSLQICRPRRRWQTHRCAAGAESELCISGGTLSGRRDGAS